MARKKNNLKLSLWIIFAVLVISAIALWFSVIRHKTTSVKKIHIAGVFLPQARADISPFYLKSTNKKPFTKSNLKGQWTMMFFGFTNCGLVCPTTMAALNKMYRDLQETLSDRQLPKIVMVSVDPERDSLKRLREYLIAFNPNFVGARADIKETVKLEKQLHIAAAKMQASGNGPDHYTINHTSDILLFNPQGQLQAYLSWPHKPKQMAEDYRSILRAVSK